MKYGFSICAAISLMPNLLSAENAVLENAYWHQGGAEISVYDLQQNRYQDIHNGQLVTVVVKEDFLTDKQVKNERYVSKNSTPILKRIELRKFATGLYDYATFSSVFTPLDRKRFPQTLKASSSVQEWCGTTFLQLNWKNTGYIGQSFSYFEAEGDRSVYFGNALLEEDLFNQIRFNPKQLPKGKLQLIPSLSLLQTQHWPLQSCIAEASLSVYNGSTFLGKDLQSYTLHQPTLQRQLEIVFEATAPYKIVGWTDSYPSVSDRKIRTTTVTLKQQKMLEYWNMARLKDAKLRKELGLK